jgi:hypothetical protein
MGEWDAVHAEQQFGKYEFRSFLVSLLLAVTLLGFARTADGQAIAQVVTSRSLPAATLEVIDPVNGTSPGTSSYVRLAVGDIILWRTSFTPVADAASRGLQGYITEYLPPNTELVGVRIIDAAGNTIEPRYPGVTVDGCSGGSSCNSFTSLPCSTGTCSFQTGSIAQVHGDTGIFYSNDARLARSPSASFLTMNNGTSMSPKPAVIDPAIVSLLGDITSPWYAHNDWDWAQVRAYGTASAVANTGGDGNTPFGYGSPVAGPDTHYGYEATEVTAGTIQFNNVLGPWNRVQYPGSTIGVGVGNIGSSSTLTRAFAETTAGFDLTPANPVEARAVRIALGETRLACRAQWNWRCGLPAFRSIRT